MTKLDRSLALSSIGADRHAAHASPDYAGPNGQYGGWLAALLLRAALDGQPAPQSVSALTVHYLAPVAPGASLELERRLLGTSRSLSFWQVELRARSEAQSLCTATAVLSSRRESDGFEELRMPVVPEPAGLDRFQIPGAGFGDQMDIRPVTKSPAFGLNDSRSIAWIRERSGRPIDEIQLAFLADVGAPRIFYYSSGPRASATLTLSVYFHAPPEELGRLGDVPLVSVLTGTRAVASTFGSRGELFSPGGVLLATMEQLCWFR